MPTPTYEVRSVNGHSSGSLEVTLVPETVDPDRMLGVQLTTDLFTPDKDMAPTRNWPTTYLDGVLGDPEDGVPATLEIDERACLQNRRAAVRGKATMHFAEGTLYVDLPEAE